MFDSYLLKGALVALYLSDMETMSAKAASAEDAASYPEFAAGMAHGAVDFDWKSYPVTTSTGY